MRVDDVCHLQSGYTARGRLEPDVLGGTLTVQLSDLPREGDLDYRILNRYQLAGIPERYLASPGDVLFRSRGETTTACVVGAGSDEPAVVVLPLLILRPNRATVLPEYLAWAINQPEAQRQLNEVAQGTNLRMIPKAALERIVIPVPDLATQRVIVATDLLARREHDLLRRLADQRRILMNLILAERAKSPQAAPGQEGSRT